MPIHLRRTCINPSPPASGHFHPQRLSPPKIVPYIGSAHLRRTCINHQYRHISVLWPLSTPASHKGRCIALILVSWLPYPPAPTHFHHQHFGLQKQGHISGSTHLRRTCINHHRHFWEGLESTNSHRKPIYKWLETRCWNPCSSPRRGDGAHQPAT